MKAQRRFGLAVWWPRVSAVFLVDVRVLVAARHGPASWQGGRRAGRGALEDGGLEGGGEPAEAGGGRSWLVLRMNPQRNVAGVAPRDSLAARLVGATERLARDLEGESCAAGGLPADELAEVDSAVL